MVAREGLTAWRARARAQLIAGVDHTVSYHYGDLQGPRLNSGVSAMHHPSGPQRSSLASEPIPPCKRTLNLSDYLGPSCLCVTDWSHVSLPDWYHPVLE